LQLLFNAGFPAIRTFELPGDQGAGVTGVQGAGVFTPSAADVAAITAGLLIELHIANGAIFAPIILSIIVAAGMLVAITLTTGNTVNGAGATPIEHVNNAPVVTCSGILINFYN
tara:strand:- start:527 stop:868 length:342 start_codon:yes stop_codon:yes gene_type:complete